MKPVPWSRSTLQGLPEHWVDPGRNAKAQLRVGCDDAWRPGTLELRDDDGQLVLEQGTVVHLVTQLQREAGSVRLTLAEPVRGTAQREVNIRYAAGAPEATWEWKELADAEVLPKRILTLEAARALPRQRVCE